MRRKPKPPPGAQPEAAPQEPGAPKTRAESCFEAFKGCAGVIVGISLMAYGEWLSFDREQRKREFFERQDRIEDVRDRLNERLERARATRTPIDFQDLWKSYDEAVQKHRREREAQERASAARVASYEAALASPPPSPPPTPGGE